MNQSTRTYTATGQVFFSSADKFTSAFGFQRGTFKSGGIDVSQAHFWDKLLVAVADKVVIKFRRRREQKSNLLE